MRKLAIVALAFALTASYCRVAWGQATWREPNPHWATFATPRDDAVFAARISLPPGYHLCGVSESYSSIQYYYVLLDRKLRCEDLDLSKFSPETMPDFVGIGGLPDVAMQYKTSADYVNAEPFYCHGMSYDIEAPKPISRASTSIAPAGPLLAGLDTIVCTREDTERDRYSKAFLAYRPSPDLVGHAYEIAAYVHLQNKRQADKLAERIAKSFRLLRR